MRVRENQKVEKGYKKNKQAAIDLMNIPKARLIEDKIPYEKLALITEFSDDEVTHELNREILKEKKDK